VRAASFSSGRSGRCGATLALALPLGLFQGWLLARSDLPGRVWFLVLAPAPLFLPPLVHVLSWFGLTGLSGIPAVVLVYVISFTPLVVLMTVKALDQINRDQAESLQLLGGRAAVVRDDLRQAFPAAAVGGALAAVFIVSDFAVPDFLTAVGPKVTVYADLLYRHHLGMRPAAVAAAALPGAVLCLLAIGWALRKQRGLGEAVSARFVAAPSVELGKGRWLFRTFRGSSRWPEQWCFRRAPPRAGRFAGHQRGRI
jgi:ABC-type Fe3+ transport system permease subunit